MNPSSPELLTQELQIKIRLKKELDRRLVEQRAMDDFPYFVTHVFAASLDAFVGGAYIERVSQFLGSSKRTARVGARDHFKSTSLYARFMWHLFRTRTSNFEAHYFSYGQDMSGYHIEKIKKLILPNPYYALCKDLKATADSVGAWTWDGEHTVTLDPKSLLSFKRGIHPEWIAVNDPFEDPENKFVVASCTCSSWLCPRHPPVGTRVASVCLSPLAVKMNESDNGSHTRQLANRRRDMAWTRGIAPEQELGVRRFLGENYDSKGGTRCR